MVLGLKRGLKEFFAKPRHDIRHSYFPRLGIFLGRVGSRDLDGPCKNAVMPRTTSCLKGLLRVVVMCKPSELLKVFFFHSDPFKNFHSFT